MDKPFTRIMECIRQAERERLAMSVKKPAARIYEMNDGDVDEQTEYQYYVEMGFVSPGGERYTGGSW